MQQFMLIALTGVNAVLIALSQTALWQRKEYRIDRMKAYLLSSEGSVFKQKFVGVAALCLVIAWSTASELFATVSLLSIFIGHSIRIYKRGVLRPDFTLRAILVLLCTILLSIVWLPTYGPLALHFATFIFFLPILVATAVGVVSIPAYMQKQAVISRARKYRNELQDLTVVGVTGSVGKTSTKTYLTHLLGGESESVVASMHHRNSPYSIAQDMLARVSKKTHTYIAELGAYIPGEIAELASLTKPSIGIVTAITNQHVGLFGSLTALAKAKWELIHALPENGTAILNKDDARISEMAKHSTQKILWFSTRSHADIFASDIVLLQHTTTCTLSIMDEVYDVTLPTISRGQLIPILAAVAGAVSLRVDSANIVKRLSTLPPLPRTMEQRSGVSGATIIDDSYSASEASVTNAIEYLGGVAATDIRLVLVPIIELGSEGGLVHKNIGRLLANLSCKVFIYGEEYKEDILHGLGAHPKAHVTWYSDAKELTKDVQTGVTAKTVVLFEGRVPSVTRSARI